MMAMRKDGDAKYVGNDFLVSALLVSWWSLPVSRWSLVSWWPSRGVSVMS